MINMRILPTKIDIFEQKVPSNVDKRGPGPWSAGREVSWGIPLFLNGDGKKLV
jgi:hypothetical protein